MLFATTCWGSIALPDKILVETVQNDVLGDPFIRNFERLEWRVTENDHRSFAVLDLSSEGFRSTKGVGGDLVILHEVDSRLPSDKLGLERFCREIVLPLFWSGASRVFSFSSSDGEKLSDLLKSADEGI